MELIDQCPNLDLCRQAGMLYDRIVDALPSPTAKWADSEAIAVTSGRFPPNVAVTDGEWIKRMQTLTRFAEHGQPT